MHDRWVSKYTEPWAASVAVSADEDAPLPHDSGLNGPGDLHSTMQFARLPIGILGIGSGGHEHDRAR
jgi:hypothetical protein